MLKSDNHKMKLQSLILLLITALLWSMGGMLIKLIKLDPIAIAGFRSLFASIVFLPFIRNPLKIKFNKLKLLCSACYAGNVVLIVMATKYTSAANAILLQYTAPIYVTLFSRAFLGENVSKREYITVIGVLVGMIIFACDGLTNTGMLGNALAIISGIFFAGVILLTKKLHTTSSLEPLFLGNLLAALLCSPSLFSGKPTAHDLGLLVLLGVFQLGISYVLYSFAIKHIPAVQISLITTLEPILNPIWVFIATGEVPSALSLAGGIIVIFFIASNYVILSIKQRKMQKEELKFFT